jgi:hypothetical protein
MSIYDQREVPAYPDFNVEPSFCRNSYVLKWWTFEHDQLIARQIEKDRWLWYWGIVDEIVRNTPPETMNAWRQEDPLCPRYAWHNVLMYFAAARAQSLGLTKKIKEPKRKICPLCDKAFVEDSLPVPLVERLGIGHLDFCAPCLRDTVLQGSGSDSLSEEAVLNYLRDLADVLKRVPNQNFGEGVEDLHGYDSEERLAILKVLKGKPTLDRVKELFGSWLEALVEAGVLDDGV